MGVVLPSSLLYITHVDSECNTKHPYNLQSTSILLVMYFRISVSFRSINHLTTFRILLDGLVNDTNPTKNSSSAQHEINIVQCLLLSNGTAIFNYSTKSKLISVAGIFLTSN